MLNLMVRRTFWPLKIAPFLLLQQLPFILEMFSITGEQIQFINSF